MACSSPTTGARRHGPCTQSHMFDLSLAWWHFPVRAAIVYVALLVLIRCSGKRTVGEFTPFDLVVVILLSESLQGGITGGDTSILGGLLAATTLIVLNYLLGRASARSPWVDRLVEGSPVVLIDDGRMLVAAARRNNIPESALLEAIR
jgi:uncharacterized membrane protein YcaP (DUF421 family)